MPCYILESDQFSVTDDCQKTQPANTQSLKELIQFPIPKPTVPTSPNISHCLVSLPPLVPVTDLLRDPF